MAFSFGMKADSTNEATQPVTYRPTFSQTSSDVENAPGDLSIVSARSQSPGGFGLFGQCATFVRGPELPHTPRLGAVSRET
jgi:hypothetical protein